MLDKMTKLSTLNSNCLCCTGNVSDLMSLTSITKQNNESLVSLKLHHTLSHRCRVATAGGLKRTWRRGGHSSCPRTSTKMR